mmetsp:Transcript_53811/g.173843  ORF Transcript_53811/g.173843 Transcript_53811/m.173843 type:complete len:538 (-) Transcript_53811:54-1667(-)
MLDKPSIVSASPNACTVMHRLWSELVSTIHGESLVGILRGMIKRTCTSAAHALQRRTAFVDCPRPDNRHGHSRHASRWARVCCNGHLPVRRDVEQICAVTQHQAPGRGIKRLLLLIVGKLQDDSSFGADVAKSAECPSQDLGRAQAHVEDAAEGQEHVEALHRSGAGPIPDPGREAAAVTGPEAVVGVERGQSQSRLRSVRGQDAVVQPGQNHGREPHARAQLQDAERAGRQAEARQRDPVLRQPQRGRVRPRHASRVQSVQLLRDPNSTDLHVGSTARGHRLALCAQHPHAGEGRAAHLVRHPTSPAGARGLAVAQAAATVLVDPGAIGVPALGELVRPHLTGRVNVGRRRRWLCWLRGIVSERVGKQHVRPHISVGAAIECLRRQAEAESPDRLAIGQRAVSVTCGTHSAETSAAAPHRQFLGTPGPLQRSPRAADACGQKSLARIGVLDRHSAAVRANAPQEQEATPPRHLASRLTSRPCRRHPAAGRRRLQPRCSMPSAEAAKAAAAATRQPGTGSASHSPESAPKSSLEPAA